jgi:hypothetical protein
LVEPPIAAWTRRAFSKAARVATCDMVRPSCTMRTMVRPVWWAMAARRASTAGIEAL